VQRERRHLQERQVRDLRRHRRVLLSRRPLHRWMLCHGLFPWQHAFSQSPMHCRRRELQSLGLQHHLGTGL
jgi:hypothetical protein